MVALKNISAYPESEDITLRLFAKGSSSWLDDVTLKDYTGQLDLAKLSGVSKQDVVQKMWKESYHGKDTQGSDRVILLSGEEGNNYQLVRLQIKLAAGGQSKLTSKGLTAITARWNTFADFVLKNFTDAGYNVVHVQYVLVTNRNYSPDEVRDLLKSVDSRPNSSFRMLDRKFLSEKIWPSQVQDLGKQYQ